jgi:hypothetical protein
VLLSQKKGLLRTREKNGKKNEEEQQPVSNFFLLACALQPVEKQLPSILILILIL